MMDSAEKPKNASTQLSMNGKSPVISTAPPFVLWLSKDERKDSHQNHGAGQSTVEEELPGRWKSEGLKKLSSALE